jgi:acyl-coenzyme A thioesterase PaaI-like protein
MSKPTKIISIRKMRWMLFLLGFFKIPLVGFIKPKLISIDENKVRVKINLRRRTKNHLNSMYFGALAVGADIAGGIHVFYFAELSNLKVSFAFKGMKADFIKRAESDVVFESNQGELVQKAINLSEETGERVNETINVIARDKNQELVATFEMIVSVKVVPLKS